MGRMVERFLFILPSFAPLALRLHVCKMTILDHFLTILDNFPTISDNFLTFPDDFLTISSLFPDHPNHIWYG